MDKKQEKDLARRMVGEIRRLAGLQEKKLRFMEVCGTHTVSIFRAGIRQLLPENIELVSGPGCPVCVTPDSYIDKAVAYAERDDIILTTFGDMLKVPGSTSSLSEAQANGADIRILYSPMDSLQIAKEHPDKKVLFLAVGFETTAPTAAATVLAAKQQGIRNLCMLSAHKLVPPALRMLLDDPEVHVDGFLLPGHVAVVTGTDVFRFLSEDYRLPGIVTGFEPLEILRSLVRLLQQKTEHRAEIGNEYGTVVRREGNPVSRKILGEVYEPVDAEWRGIGTIPMSGLCMRDEYADYDIERLLPLTLRTEPKKSACRCGEVLRGIVSPPACPLFGKACVPTHAVGPCMVSVEGVCAAWHKYGSGRFTYGK